MNNPFGGLITSKTRIRILMRLFLNPGQHAYLREMAGEFNLSPSQVREELQHLNKAGLLEREKSGRQINYRANKKHPLFPELHSMVQKALGMDRILDSIIERLGDLDLALITGDYAEGKDSGIIDLVLVGNPDARNLLDLTHKTERYIGRKIRVLVLSIEDYSKMVGTDALQPGLLLWQRKNAICE